MKPYPAQIPEGTASVAASSLHAALGALSLMAAGALSVGTSKKPGPSTPPPPPSGQTSTPAPRATPDTGPGEATPDLPVASLLRGRDPGVGGTGSTAGLPALPTQQRALPDGLFHGYVYTTPGARECTESLPKGVFVRCSIDRGRLLGCGDAVFRSRSTVVCQGGQYLTCRVDAAGRLQRCGAAYSGWTVTEKRGSLRRCCVRDGKIKYCTNDEDYLCTTADRRRVTPPPPRHPATVPAPLYGHRDPGLSPHPPQSPPPPRRGSFQRCSIFNGQVSFCRGWYHGYAVVYHDGAYRRCRIFNGQISSCGSWYQGHAVAFRDGALRSCRIFNGQISHCGTWFKGEAAVFRPE